MTQLLDLLVCQRCGEHFWPEQEPWAAWILCSGCGAPHANARRIDRTPRGYFGSIRGRHAPELLAWLNRWWPDALPPAERFAAASPDLLRTGSVDGFPYMIERTFIQAQVPCTARVLVAAFSAASAGENAATACDWRPDHSAMWMGSNQDRIRAFTPPPVQSAEQVGPGLVHVGYSRAGAWAYSEDRAGVNDLVGRPERWARALVERLAQRGAEPPLTLVEARPEDAARVAISTSLEPVAAGDLSDVEGRALRCGACGADFPASAVLGGALCPFCSAALTLEPQVAAAIDGYRRGVRAYQLRSPAVLDADKLWTSGEDEIGLSCAACGAPNAHQPGRLDEACQYCRSALIPGTGVMDLAVRRVAEEAREERVETDRRFDRTARAWNRFYSIHAWFSAGVMALSVLSYIACIPVVVVGAHANFGIWASLAILLVALGVLGGLAVGAGLLVRQRWVEKRAWNRAYESLAEQLGGRLGNVGVLERWLPRFWRDQFPLGAFQEGPREGAVEFDLATLPMVLEADPRPASSTWGSPKLARAVVLAAGRLPADARRRLRSGPAGETRAALERCGFVVEPHVGGLLVKAMPETISALCRAPWHLKALGPVAFATARLAHQLEIGPVQVARG